MDQMEDLIQSRKETIDNVVSLLVDINTITKDINTELGNQGTNLELIRTDMEDAKQNTEAGNV